MIWKKMILGSFCRVDLVEFQKKTVRNAKKQCKVLGIEPSNYETNFTTKLYLLGM